MHERSDTTYTHPSCTVISRLHVYSAVVSVHHMRYAHIVPPILLLLLYYDNYINAHTHIRVWVWYYIISNAVANFVNNTIITVVTVCDRSIIIIIITDVTYIVIPLKSTRSITTTTVKMCTMNITKWLNHRNIIGLYYKSVRSKNLMGVKKLKWPSKTLTSFWFLR